VQQIHEPPMILFSCQLRGSGGNGQQQRQSK